MITFASSTCQGRLTDVGVNTGFGGSADTSTRSILELQREIMRGLQYGITLPLSSDCEDGDTYDPFDNPLPLLDDIAATVMPETWVRAAMLIRLNSLSGGASGVRLSTIETLQKLIEHNIVPRIPIRGSISASGDSPLSYIGGAMQGKPAISVWITDRSRDVRIIISADSALADQSLEPVRFVAKEGLAIVNGTAFSAAVGALAMHEIICQSALCQIVAAMSVEALNCTDESFDHFFAQVRPHPGQRDSAKALRLFLQGSELVFRSASLEESSLRQDRYSIRTVPQWIGPAFEDVILAYHQIKTELNSVTDNPLVTKDGRMLHGGNFQAKSVTSAMEKVRQACHTIGRMYFVQCTEIINPSTNRGLPPNLVVDEPSESSIFKGTDIMVAALQSELGFLANPVASHVQTAEKGNQALNFLALISGRYTLQATDVLAQLAAAHLVALCQALDLCAMSVLQFKALQDLCNRAVETHLKDSLRSDSHQSLL